MDSCCWVVGERVALDPKDVSEHAIARMRFQVNSLNLALPFDCSSCGAERLGNFNDPGLLALYNFTCSDALGTKECKKSYLPRRLKRDPYFLPGSLVYCSMKAYGDVPWPAIVDYCPDGEKGYYLGEDEEGRKRAYFVVLLHPGKPSDRSWVGGFFSTAALVPFTPRSIPIGASSAFAGALGMATKAYADRLTQRLKDLSFIVYAAELRGRPIEIDVMSMELDPARNEQGSSTAERSKETLTADRAKESSSVGNAQGSNDLATRFARETALWKALHPPLSYTRVEKILRILSEDSD